MKLFQEKFPRPWLDGASSGIFDTIYDVCIRPGTQ